MTKLYAVGANIFAGGFTLGVSKHFKVLGHLEHDTYGVSIAQRNLPDLQFWTSTADWPKNLKVDFVYANPPCAIWSVAGSRKGQDPEKWRRDPRLNRIKDIFTLVDRYRPAAWVWESVCQAFTKGHEFVGQLAKEAKAMGYAATVVLLDAQYLNTPQTRRRMFLVFHRVAIDWKAARPDFKKQVTVKQALIGVKPNPGELKRKIPDRIKRLYPMSRPGEDFNKVFNRVTKPKDIKRNARGQITGRPSFLVKRMHLNQPGYTVIGAELLHPTKCRALTTNELAALCGYPNTWKWGDGSGLGNFVARGVCPTVGEWLARHIAAGIRKGLKVDPKISTIVDYRKPPGEVILTPERVGPHLLRFSPASAPPRQPSAASRALGIRPKRPRLRMTELAAATKREIPGPEEQARIKAALRDLRNGVTPKVSKLLIRARLIEGKLSDDQIVVEVLRRYPKRKTTQADVAYHRYKLRHAGMI